MNRLILVIVAVVVIVLAAVGLLVIKVTSMPPSAAIMFTKWSNAIYTANYSISYLGTLNIFNVLGVKVNLTGPSIVWSQDTLNNILLSMPPRFNVLVAAKHVSGNVYHVCVAIPISVLNTSMIRVCGDMSESQFPIISSLFSGRWSYVGTLTVSGISSYCYESSYANVTMSYRLTLCIAPNGVLTMAKAYKSIPSGYYNITLTLISVSNGRFLSSYFNEAESASNTS